MPNSTHVASPTPSGILDLGRGLIPWIVHHWIERSVQAAFLEHPGAAALYLTRRRGRLDPVAGSRAVTAG
jgi:hypothetical protein